MEFKIQKKRLLFLIAAIIGFVAFFLPWVRGGFLGQHSGYDLLSYGRQMGESKSWLLILLPISFLFIILSKLGIIKGINPILIKIIEVIPIILISFSFFKLTQSLGVNVSDLAEIDTNLLQVFKIGFPLTIITSIIVAFAPSTETQYTSLNN